MGEGVLLYVMLPSQWRTRQSNFNTVRRFVTLRHPAVSRHSAHICSLPRGCSGTTHTLRFTQVSKLINHRREAEKLKINKETFLKKSGIIFWITPKNGDGRQMRSKAARSDIIHNRIHQRSTERIQDKLRTEANIKKYRWVQLGRKELRSECWLACWWQYLEFVQLVFAA